MTNDVCEHLVCDESLARVVVYTLLYLCMLLIVDLHSTTEYIPIRLHVVDYRSLLYL